MFSDVDNLLVHIRKFLIWVLGKLWCVIKLKHYVDIDFWNWSLTIRLRYSKEYITDGSNLSCFFSESIWTFETIWDSSDHSIENMICRTLQHFSRGFKRQNLFPVSMKEFQCQMDSNDLFTKIYIVSIHLKKFRFRWIQNPSEKFRFRWPFFKEYKFWIHSEKFRFRWPFGKEYIFWIHLKNANSDGFFDSHYIFWIFQKKQIFWWVQMAFS